MEKQHGRSENTEDEELSDAESLSSNDAGNWQELPKKFPSNTTRQNNASRS
jgi:hypothetical protein